MLLNFTLCNVHVQLYIVCCWLYTTKQYIVHCRSRSQWYGNPEPEHQGVVATEIAHVWPGVREYTTLLGPASYLNIFLSALRNHHLLLFVIEKSSWFCNFWNIQAPFIKFWNLSCFYFIDVYISSSILEEIIAIMILKPYLRDIKLHTGKCGTVL